MAFDIAGFKKVMAEKAEWLLHELQGIRTGRATPALLDAVKVEVYGSMMPVSQTASVAVQDARTLYVTPWDKTQIKPIEKAITVADLGVSVGSDDNGVRVSFPDLTTERRAQLGKLVRGKLEEARIAVRGARAKSLGDLDKSGASENEIERLKAEIQKSVDETNKKLEESAEKKEKELMS